MNVPDWLAHLRTDRRGIPVPWLNRYGDPDQVPERWRIDHDPYVRGPALFCDDYGDEPNFLRMHMARQRQAMTEGRCSVCGRLVAWSRRHLVVSSISVEFIRTPELGEAAVVDEPWLCERCARFSVERCPGLIRRSRAGDCALVHVRSPRFVRLVVSSGYIDGPLEEESRRVEPAMWVKALVSRKLVRIDPDS